MKRNFTMTVSCLYFKLMEDNLKRAVFYEHVDSYMYVSGILNREYHIKGASEVFVKFVKDLIVQLN